MEIIASVNGTVEKVHAGYKTYKTPEGTKIEAGKCYSIVCNEDGTAEVKEKENDGYWGFAYPSPAEPFKYQS